MAPCLRDPSHRGQSLLLTHKLSFFATAGAVLITFHPFNNFSSPGSSGKKKNDGGGPSVGVGWGVCSRVGRVSSTKPTASVCVCVRAGEPVSGAGRVGRGGYDFIYYFFFVFNSLLCFSL